eukprot:TRINITY_DN12654_c0_g1_i1.p1 TRINITY_DN12654_c0_g1~~TRINITY_DN12654_c0_g1_i1.p1  ORF type:complete len:476 (+),score=104.00 TRINITY_DN12654_c0_g1_i1:51-1478(+)
MQLLAAVLAACASIPGRQWKGEAPWHADRDLEEELAQWGCTVPTAAAEDNSALSGMRGRTPVLLTGSTQLADLSSAIPTPARLAARAEEFSDVLLRVRQAGEDWVDGHVQPSDRDYMTLRDFLLRFRTHNLSTFEFSPRHASMFRSLMGAGDDWPPKALQQDFPPGKSSTNSATLGIWGGSGRGATVHDHPETYFALLQGSKWWVLWPPGGLEQAGAEWVLDTVWPQQVYMTRQVRELLSAAEGTHRKPLVCLQRAGEVMYVPDYWWHATVNVGESVGFGEQQRGRAPDLTAMTKQRPRAYRTAFALSSAYPDDRRSLQAVSRAAAAAPWTLVLGGRIVDWGRLLLRHGDDAGGDGGQLAPLRAALIVLRKALLAREGGGDVSPRHAAKEMRMWAMELLQLLFGVEAAPATAAEWGLLEAEELLHESAVRNPQDAFTVEAQAFVSERGAGRRWRPAAASEETSRPRTGSSGRRLQ